MKTAQTICPHCGRDINSEAGKINLDDLDVLDKILLQLYNNMQLLTETSSDIRLTQEGLSSTLKMHQPQVARALKHLKKVGLILIKKPHYVEGPRQKRIVYIPSKKGKQRVEGLI